jgi:glutathione S-transferase
MSDPFVPVLYLKHNCPHCLKVRLFLLEADLLNRFVLREFVPGDHQEEAIRGELAPHFDKVTFPTLQYAPGHYMHDSDAIIAWIAGERGIDRAALPIFTTYAKSVLPKYMEARKALKAA